MGLAEIEFSRRTHTEESGTYRRKRYAFRVVRGTSFCHCSFAHFRENQDRVDGSGSVLAQINQRCGDDRPGNSTQYTELGGSALAGNGIINNSLVWVARRRNIIHLLFCQMNVRGQK